MAVTRGSTSLVTAMPADLLAAIEAGDLTDEQLRQLITLEAADLGLTAEEAIRRGREGSLPKNATGMDLELLVELISG